MKSNITGTWEETVDMFSCASLLQREICTIATSQKKWFPFKPIMITDSCSSIDFYAQANHFNLLLPQGSCCSAPPPENTAFFVLIDFSLAGKLYASAVKQTLLASPSVKLPSASTVWGLVLGHKKKENLYFLPWKSHKDLKFHTKAASAFSLHMLSYGLLLGTVSTRVLTRMEASFVGPVNDQRAQFSTTKECARFFRINNALLPFLLVNHL